MSNLIIIDTPFPDVKLIKRNSFEDDRGQFSRIFCSDELKETFKNEAIAQINFSETFNCGTIRGMHYQPHPYSEIKLVSCVRGKIFDVVVDIRPKSKTYLSWFGEILSEDNKLAMMVPEGFAHGFQSLKNNVQLIYCHSKKFNPIFEMGLNPIDPKIKIQWPLPIAKISKRDAEHPFI